MSVMPRMHCSSCANMAAGPALAAETRTSGTPRPVVEVVLRDLDRQVQAARMLLRSCLFIPVHEAGELELESISMRKNVNKRLDPLVVEDDVMTRPDPLSGQDDATTQPTRPICCPRLRYDRTYLFPDRICTSPRS